MNIKIELKFICSLSHSLGRLPFKKKYQNKWWWKTWRNWKLHALLVGMYSHYEKQYVVPQNIKNKVTIWFSNSTFVDILNWKKGLKYICTIMFIAVFFTIAQRYTYNIILVLKRINIPTCATTRMNLQDIIY